MDYKSIFFWIIQLFNVGVGTFLFYRIYRLHISSERLNQYVIEYYESKGLTVEGVYKLNTTDRLKYGVPVIGFLRIYNYYFGIYTGKIEHTRMVELLDQQQKEYTKYIELTVRNKQVSSLKEFESYAW